MPVWSAEVDLDEGLVRRLLAQFALDGARLHKLAEGWDNSVWVVDARYAFRFPRREVAIPGLEREIAVLPKLAPQLPLPVPVPAFVGEPTEEYPWPFFGAELIPGVEAGVAELDDEARLAIALELAAFLRALHASSRSRRSSRTTRTAARTCPSGLGSRARSWPSWSGSASGTRHRSVDRFLEEALSACRRRRRRRSRTATSTSGTCSSTAARRAA